MIIIDHIGLIRDDICNTTKKIHARKKGMNFKKQFFRPISVYNNIEMDLIQSVFNVKKY